MSAQYRAIQWNSFKRRYDLAMAIGVAGYLAAFVVLGKLILRGDRAINDEILVMRATGSCALILLHFTLCIGPLARLERRFLPLLYNRRHLGVTTFALAAVHGTLAIGFYHGFGVVSPIRSLLTSNTNYTSLEAFPFEILGAIALLILFLMAATSHDFWLKNLTPGIWKWLHMLVYPAWGLVIVHVSLGAMQSHRSALYPILLPAGAILVASLHIAAGQAQRRRDRSVSGLDGEFIDVCAVSEIRDGRGKAVALPEGESVAIFRHGRCLSAVSNVCAHQGGPLAEGRIIDGCITCPWHGYQYLPASGCAPPPFTEKLATFRIRVEKGRVLIDPQSLPPGTEVEPACIEEQHA